jgi:hypothetical protein
MKETTKAFPIFYIHDFNTQIHIALTTCALQITVPMCKL